MRELLTDRLRLRAFTDDDVDFVQQVHSHPGVARFIPGQAATDRAAARAQTTRFQTLVEHLVHGFYCVTLRESGIPVGMILCKPIPPSAGVDLDDVEIGWRQHPEHDGHGYAAEAAAAVLRHALDSGLPRVVAVTSPENHASQRLCRRIGMEHRGRTGDYYDEVCELFVACAPYTARERFRPDPPGGTSMAGHTADEDFDPTVNDVSFEIEGDEDPDALAGDEEIEPGSEGAYGTGVEGADQILEDERVRAAGDEINEWADFSDEYGQDDSAAAEQGNRDQDQMISGGDAEREVEQLSGDDWNVDAVGDSELPADEQRLAEGVDLDDEAADLGGSVDGEDPLAGGADRKLSRGSEAPGFRTLPLGPVAGRGRG